MDDRHPQAGDLECWRGHLWRPEDVGPIAPLADPPQPPTCPECGAELYSITAIDKDGYKYLSRLVPND